MGVEVKSGGEGVIVADRGCNDSCCNRNNSGWGSGWGAVGGALVGGGFGAAAVSVPVPMLPMFFRQNVIIAR